MMLSLTLKPVEGSTDRLQVFYGQELVASISYLPDGPLPSYSWNSYIQMSGHPYGEMWVSSREHLADAMRDIEWLLRFRPREGDR